jgi:ABC-type phosphate transport system auxiliary subunit
MSTQTKSKLFLLIIAILLLTNVAMLYFLFNKDKTDGKKPSFDKGTAAREFLQKEIGFNADQMQQYDTLAKQQREKMKAAFEGIRTSKEQIFKDLGNKSFSDSAIAEAVSKSSENQKNMERQFYSNMLQVRKLCTAGQQPKFDSLFYKMWSRKPKKAEEKK